jgi:hypothetical protein
MANGLRAVCHVTKIVGVQHFCSDHDNGQVFDNTNTNMSFICLPESAALTQYIIIHHHRQKFWTQEKNGFLHIGKLGGLC